MHFRAGVKRLVLLALVPFIGVLPSQATEPDLYALPALPNRVIEPAFFGTHVHNLVLRGRVQDPPQPTPFPADLVGAVRLWDSVVRWAEIEPENGRFVFDRLDTYVNGSLSNNARVLLTLGSTPCWASARSDEPCSYGFGCAAEPANLAHWDRYVQTLARRYKGRVSAYEVWNEPHPGQRFEGHRGFFSGDMAALLELARRAHTVLQQEDPQALLLTPGFVNRLPLLERYLAQGGKQWAQALAYHLYASGDRQLLEQLRELRAILARQGVAQWPIFDTESSFDRADSAALQKAVSTGTPVRDDHSTAALHVRALILKAFAGVQASYHHGWDNGHSGMVDRELKPTASYAPYVAVRKWLLGVRPQGCASYGAELVRCVATQQGQRVWLVWRKEPGPAVVLPLDSGVSPPGWLAWQQAGAAKVQSVREGGPAQITVGFMPVAVWWPTS
jgi:Glycosyl hydrolase family 10